jgi:hypothetical protein
MNTNFSTKTKLSSLQDKNNKGDNGFFPCPTDILDLILKSIEFKIPLGADINIGDFVGGLGDQLYFFHKVLEDKGFTPKSYYNEMQLKRFNIAESRYGGVNNFNLLNTDFFFMKLSGKKDSKERKDIIPLIYANPPYFDMVDKFDSSKYRRSEDVFFSDFHEYNCKGGVLLYIVRQPQLAAQVELMRKITYRYENISILKFPTMTELADLKGLTESAYITKLANEMQINKSKLTDFDQVVIIGQKKNKPSNDKEIADYWIEELREDNVSSLYEYIKNNNKPLAIINEDVIKHQLSVSTFRDKRVSEITLSKGLDSVLDELLHLVDSEQNNVGIRAIKQKPIIEKTVGNITNVILAGGEDGLLGGLLIKGSTIKEIQTFNVVDDETGDNVTTEVERLSPCISAINNKGNSYYKSY